MLLFFSGRFSFSFWKFCYLNSPPTPLEQLAIKLLTPYYKPHVHIMRDLHKLSACVSVHVCTQGIIAIMQEFELWSNKTYLKTIWTIRNKSKWYWGIRLQSKKQVSSLAENWLGVTIPITEMTVHSGLEISGLSLISDICLTFVATNQVCYYSRFN